MSPSTPRKLLAWSFAQAAADYARNLPLEHFMEATSQGRQREITLESLALVKARRPEVQVFNELLVQYRRRGQREIVQVVPDNMIVIHPEPVQAEGSFDVPLQHPIKLFWTLEYVSHRNRRKDYEDSFKKYERDLKVPFYLMFYPEDQELTLYRHNGRKYVSVRPNEQERYLIPKLELEVGLLDGWARYWYRGELLPLPAELLRDLEEERRLREVYRQQVEQERLRAEQSEQRAEEQRQRAEQSEQRAEQERQMRLALEQELERLRSQGSRRNNRHAREE
ncbi:MAG TPA: Uma2 family endonuclease [Gemmataceae bacterium]|nr:Uma2 family endonuclease [Gemmataceae bacterium]